VCLRVVCVLRVCVCVRALVPWSFDSSFCAFLLARGLSLAGSTVAAAGWTSP